MAAPPCGGSAGAANLTAQKTTAAQSGYGRCVVTVRVSSSISSLRPRISPGAVRCSLGAPPPPPVEGNCVHNKRRNDAWESLESATADMFRPLLMNIADMLSLRTVYDLADYQIGMLSGAILGSVGVYQLWKAAPSIFVDTTLAWMVYKLSVVSSELHRQGKSNSLITRLKFGIILAMILKDFKKNYVLLDAIRMPLFFMYLGTFIFDVAGMKKYGRRFLITFVNLLKTRGGVREIFRIMWYPGYISPYDDLLGWK